MFFFLLFAPTVITLCAVLIQGLANTISPRSKEVRPIERKECPAEAPHKAPVLHGASLKGQCVAFVGRIPGHTHAAAGAMVEKLGGEFSPGIHSKVSLLVIGDHPGDGKLLFAQKNAVSTISAAEFLSVISAALPEESAHIAPAQPEAHQAPAAPDALVSLRGKCVAFTGAVPGMTRIEAGREVERCGGTYTDGIHLGVSLMVIGDKPGQRKREYAAANRIPTITAAEFLSVISAPTPEKTPEISSPAPLPEKAPEPSGKHDEVQSSSQLPSPPCVPEKAPENRLYGRALTPDQLAAYPDRRSAAKAIADFYHLPWGDGVVDLRTYPPSCYQDLAPYRDIWPIANYLRYTDNLANMA